MTERILVLLQERPHYFHEILERVDADYRQLVAAWLDIRARHHLVRDEMGHYSLS